MLATAGLAGPIGRGLILVGVVASLFGALAAVVAARSGDRRTAKLTGRFAWLAFAAAAGAFAAMEWAMITRDFSLAYVQKVGSWSTPALYNVAAVWSALEGSILLWVLVLAGLVLAVHLWLGERRRDELGLWALATMFSVLLFFFLLSFGPANPFAAGPPGVLDGPGPNPLLQNHILVMFHPPALYLGYVGFTVPFAFAIGALVTGRLGEGWLVATRRWTLVAWGFLTFGIFLGGWWSYEVLGWSGVWAWDPVENASLLPWLTATAYIHSVFVQEQRGMLRVWNISLLTATFSLTILGTFLTRSGVVASVHAFSQSAIGPWLLVFFAIVVAVSVGLIGWRGDRLRSPGSIVTPVSREGAFLVNNLLFAVFAFVVLLGTVFPLVVEALQARTIVVGEPFFDRMAVPLGLAMLTIMAIAPLLPWHRAGSEVLWRRVTWPAWGAVVALVAAVVSGASGVVAPLACGLGGAACGAALRQLVLAVRRHGPSGLLGRTSGGMVVHIGVVLIAVALGVSNTYTRSQELDLVVGRLATFAGHTFELVELLERSDERSTSVVARVSIDGGQAYAPAITRFTRIGMTVGTPSVRTSPTVDVYLTLQPPVRLDSGAARIKVFIKPMILWLWVGGFVMALGTALALVPRRRGSAAPEDGADEPDDALVPST